MDDRYFFNYCDLVSAMTSQCKSREVGAVIVKDGKVISSSGNRVPKNHEPCEICKRKTFASGYGLELCPNCHAERSAIFLAAKLGISLDGSSLYLNSVIPCRECSKAIVESGITDVHVLSLESYQEPGIHGIEILMKSGVRLHERYTSDKGEQCCKENEEESIRLDDSR